MFFKYILSFILKLFLTAAFFAGLMTLTGCQPKSEGAAPVNTRENTQVFEPMQIKSYVVEKTFLSDSEKKALEKRRSAKGCLKTNWGGVIPNPQIDDNLKLKDDFVEVTTGVFRPLNERFSWKILWRVDIISSNTIVLKGYVEESQFNNFVLYQNKPIMMIQTRSESNSSPAARLSIEEKDLDPQFASYRKSITSVPYSEKCFVSTFLSEEKNKTIGTYTFENGAQIPVIQDLRVGTYKVICSDSPQRVLNVTRETLYSLSSPSKDMIFCGGTKIANLETIRDEQGEVIQSIVQQLSSAPIN